MCDISEHLYRQLFDKVYVELVVCIPCSAGKIFRRIDIRQKIHFFVGILLLVSAGRIIGVSSYSHSPA